MPKDFSRTERVNQQLHKEIASILQQEFKHRFPHIGMVTVSDVEVSRDLSHAKVFVSFFLDDEEKNEKDFNQLKDAAPFVRMLLAKRVKMRAIPAVHFVRDNSMLEGAKISALVDDAIAKDKKKQQK